MKNLFARLFCKHRWQWVRNIYGDEINLLDGKRSVWQCSECQQYQYRNELKNEQ
jgi:hypothetical protein